jgi:hypothetical protein
MPDMDSPFSELKPSLERLSHLSVEGYYNPYRLFEWPAKLSDGWWMSESLMTTHGTRFATELDESQRKLLSKWESINFYSLNVHGIRELLMEVTLRIHSPGYEPLSDFLHHFIGEENEHMWFFAEFCRRYGGKLYPDKKIKLASTEEDRETIDFLVFSRILIIEEVIDYFNVQMAKDMSLDPVVRKINAVHHQDESRHIAFGRQVIDNLHSRLRARLAPEKLSAIETYLKNYMKMFITSLYNPSVYRDAGIAEPYKFREELLKDPARNEKHEHILARTTGFFVKSGIFSSAQVFVQ